MSKKVELAGETYIVSENFDFEQLDTETMVENVQSDDNFDKTSKALKKQIKNKRKSIQNKLHPKINFKLKFGEQIYDFESKLCSTELLKDGSGTYKVIMNFVDLCNLQHLLFRAISKNKLLEFTEITIELSNKEKLNVFKQNNEDFIYALFRVKMIEMLSSSLKNKNEMSYVEIEFGSTNLL